MSTVNLTINGQTIQAEGGKTILQAAQTAGIDIPTLCRHSALNNLGGCRLCVVEIAKQPLLHPACTYPVIEGMEVQTESPRVVEMRKFVLELLFSERNHYCMYCEMSGDCELQAAAYRYGLDHWTYPTPNPRYPVDGTRKYFIMDHNRCILCRRCIRACSDKVANHTLGLKFRGIKTMICADMDVSFGESSCVNCGTCLQVCPTGALVDRRSAYMGRNAQVEKTASACTFCGVGCKINVVTRAGRLLRVEGDWDGHNEGVLCQRGRFDSLAEERERVTSPMLRGNGKLEPVSLDEALGAVAAKIKAAGGGAKIKAVATGRALNETLKAFVEVFKDKVGAGVGVLEPVFSGNGGVGLSGGGVLADLDAADCVLLVGADPLTDQPVLGYRIKRAKYRGANVLLVGGEDNPMARFAARRFKAAELGEAVKLAAESQKPVVVYGPELSVAAAKKLAPLKDKAAFIGAGQATNGRGAEAFALKSDSGAEGLELAYLLASDTAVEADVVKRLRKAKFLVAHASYHGPLTEAADVVLPATLWHERRGTFSNLEGKTLTVTPAVAPPEWLTPEAEVLAQLAARL